MLGLREGTEAQAADFYAQLQTLSFVEVFAERGHNIHERTRKLMLERLWQQNQEEFVLLSARAVTFFEQNDSSSAVQIEWLYHLVVADREWQNSDLWNWAQEWWNNFRLAELESLIQTLLEQVEAQRISVLATAEIYYWSGKTRFLFYQFVAALSQYQQALELFRIVGSRLGEANTLQGIGFLQEDLDRGLEYCLMALELYTEINDKYSQSRHLIMTSEILVKLGRQQEAIEFLHRRIELAKEISYSPFVEYAEAKLQEITGNKKWWEWWKWWRK